MNNEQLSEKMIEKSIEAFTMALEIYNKPTIKYRVEGFALFVCNAWELMLKAKLLKDGKPIYYKDSNNTLSLPESLKRVITNKNSPLRKNINTINNGKHPAPSLTSSFSIFSLLIIKYSF